MIKFICLGSGSSGNCYVLWTEQTTILVDAGLGIRSLKRSLLEAGHAVADIDAILVTHDHADHIKAVGYMSKDYDVPVYATELVHEGINSNYSVGIKVRPEKKHVIEKGVRFSVGDFQVTPFGVPHDSNDCVGYRIEAEGITFVILTDVGHVTTEIQKEVARAHYLVVEANHDVDMLKIGPYPAYLKGRILSDRGHMSNATCGQLLAEHASQHLRHVWLCHLSEENNHPELARKTVEGILHGYGIVPGKDFELEVLRRRNASEIYEL